MRSQRQHFVYSIKWIIDSMISQLDIIYIADQRDCSMKLGASSYHPSESLISLTFSMEQAPITIANKTENKTL